MESNQKKLQKRLTKTEIDLWVEDIINLVISKEDLIKLLYSQDKVVLFNVFWIISTLAHSKASMLLGLELDLLQAMLSNKDNDSVVRNVLSSFKKIAIPVDIEDELYCFSMQVLESKNSPIAHRSFALWVCYRISLHHPDLQPELLGLAKVILETYGTESPGVKSITTKAVKLLTAHSYK